MATMQKTGLKPGPNQGRDPGDQAGRIEAEIFLTPRVLDDGAFRSYADSLKALIRDAQERGEKLTSTSTDTARVCDAIREAARTLQERSTRGEKIARNLETQTARAESLIERLASAISNDRELERLADMVIEQRRAAFQERVARSVEDLFARYETVESHAAQAEARAEQAERRVEQAEAKARQLEARLDALDERTHATIAAAEHAVERLTATLNAAVTNAQDEQGRLESWTAQSAHKLQQAGMIALEQAEKDVDALRLRSAEAIEQTELRADRAVTNALDAIEQLRSLAAGIAVSADEDAERLESRLAPYRGLVDRVSSLLGDGETPGVLPSVLERAESVARTLEQAAPSLSGEIERAERIRTVLSASLESAQERVSALETRREEICRTLEQEIEAIGGDLSPIEHAAAGLRVRIEQLEQRGQSLADRLESAPGVPVDADAIDRLRTEADEIINSSLHRVEEAGTWLAGLIHHAQSMAAREET